MSIISINNLEKKYDAGGLAVNALRGISMNLDKGEFTAIAGPSGSGKTTLLNIIGGLDAPSSGSVLVADNDLTGMNARELSDLRLHRIGFIFQAYNLIPVLTALENVEYVLLLRGVSKNERYERSASILAEVGLENELNRLPKELSGGQQQRIAVARAIVSEPDIVLADEPTANLDQVTGGSLLDLMREMNRRKKITFLFSTHDTMVMDRADRLIRLLDGRIQSDTKATPKKTRRAQKRTGNAKKV